VSFIFLATFAYSPPSIVRVSLCKLARPVEG
jgi:hypothetical protein